jgi:hypothetical protein
MKVHLNMAVLERHLKSAAADHQRRQLAEAIAENVRAKHIQVGPTTGGDGDSSTTDLPVLVSDDGHVYLAHPAGEAVEAKYGALVKAVAELGLEVNR